jgi:hypothetical protein
MVPEHTKGKTRGEIKMDKESKDVLVEFIVQSRKHGNVDEVLDIMDTTDEVFDGAVKQLESLQVQTLEDTGGQIPESISDDGSIAKDNAGGE